MITGIIGKPNTGKSTFFNAVTLLNVPMANYPFTTIKPNFGVAYVRVECVCRVMGVTDNPVNSRCINGSRLIPVKIIDVAGLVKDASKGRGLGNKFLDDLRQADALIHVVDASGSTDEEGRPLDADSNNPIKDIEFVEREFDLWVYQILKRDWSQMIRSLEGHSEKFSSLLAERLSGLSIIESEIRESIEKARLQEDSPINWSDNDLLHFCTVLREVSKPTVIAANKADLPSSRNNIKELTNSNRLTIPCASEAELLLRRASEKGLIQYIPGDKSIPEYDKSKLSESQKRALSLVDEQVFRIYESTGVQDIINSVYLELLDGVVVYPVEDESKLSDKEGRILPDSYILKRGSTSKDLASRIHTDLGKTFLYAVDAKKKVRLSADYILQDSDIIKIVATGKRN